MRAFDHDYVNELVARLGALQPDARPAWGTLTPDQMVGHLIETVRYTMGREPDVPFVGNWFMRTVVGPLIMNGIIPIPKNVKAPRPNPNAPWPTGDVETLHAALEDYLNLAQTGDLHPPYHPVFGEIGVDGWAKMHVRHFEHHLKQFVL